MAKVSDRLYVYAVSGHISNLESDLSEYPVSGPIFGKIRPDIKCELSLLWQISDQTNILYPA